MHAWSIKGPWQPSIMQAHPTLPTPCAEHMGVISALSVLHHCTAVLYITHPQHTVPLHKLYVLLVQHPEPGDRPWAKHS